MGDEHQNAGEATAQAQREGEFTHGDPAGPYGGSNEVGGETPEGTSEAAPVEHVDDGGTGEEGVDGQEGSEEGSGGGEGTDEGAGGGEGSLADEEGGASGGDGDPDETREEGAGGNADA